MVRRVGGLMVAGLVLAGAASAQPTLTVSPTEVPSGTAVTVTISGPPGLYWALAGSPRDAGLVYGGVALPLGPDAQVLATGVFTGVPVTLALTPPIGSANELYHLLAVQSANASYVPPVPSTPVALRRRGFYTNTPTFTAGLSAGGARIQQVGTPAIATDAATKGYVDASAVLLGSGPAQPVASPNPVVQVEQRGSGPLLSLRTNSSAVPGGGGALINREQFRVLSDGGFVASGQLSVGTIPASGPGQRLMYYPSKAAFRAGGVFGNQWDDASIGSYSWAGGYSTRATGYGAFAFGDQVTVSGTLAAALGAANVVAGTAAFAAGADHVAAGFGGVALGYGNTASGQGSAAIGFRVASCGDYGIAIGHRASTASAPTLQNPCNGTARTGAVVFADFSSPSDHFGAVTNNEFAARAAGGFRFRSNGATTTGCNLPAGSGVWSCSSDRNLKTGFTPVDGEEVLAKLATMPIERWSYVSEPGVVHLGPTAQDFRAAFGLGVDDTTIGHLDEAGVSLRAIQALEARTRALADQQARTLEENARLAAENERLQRRLSDVLDRLETIERASRRDRR